MFDTTWISSTRRHPTPLVGKPGLEATVERAGCDVTDIVDHGGVRSVYFTDPSGIALEASWWALDATGRSVDYDDVRFFGATNPVPALQELRETGRLSHPPSVLSA